jgi:transposase-like protein
VRGWLARHPRVTFHFTPTSCSWANAVEGWFAKLTRQRLKRGVFTSIVELQTAINRFIAEANDKPKPFVRTKSEIRDRQLLQCRHCRYQTSLIAGTVLQGTKLPMRVWFRAMHLLAQGKKGLSNIELGRRLGISTNAAWRVQHKQMQTMNERDRRYMLGAAGPRIEIDDAYRR